MQSAGLFSVKTPTIFTPGMITDNRLWTMVLGQLTSKVDPIFAPFASNKSVEEYIKTHFSPYATKPHHIVGFSMGGYISIEYLHQNPASLCSLVLISTSSRGYSDVEKAQRKKLIDAAEKQFAEIISSSRLSQWLSPTSAHRQENIALLQIMASTAGAAEFIRQQSATLDRQDRRETLRQITLPTLIIHGADDKLIPASEAKALAESMPNATLHIVKNAGHMIPLEQPEQLAGILNDWFQQPHLKEKKNDF